MTIHEFLTFPSNSCLDYPDAPASTRVGLAYCFHCLGNDKKALRALDRALQLDPTNETALAIKASIQRNLPSLSPSDRIESSLQTIRQLYAINQSHPQALTYIADHYFNVWRVVEGVECSIQKGDHKVQFVGDLKSLLTPSMFIRINGVIVKIGANMNCISSSTITLSMPYEGETIQNCPLEIRLTKKALEYATNALKYTKINSLKSEAYEIMGRCYHYLHNWSHANDALTKAVRSNGKNSLALYEASQVYVSVNRIHG